MSGQLAHHRRLQTADREECSSYTRHVGSPRLGGNPQEVQPFQHVQFLDVILELERGLALPLTDRTQSLTEVVSSILHGLSPESWHETESTRPNGKSGGVEFNRLKIHPLQIHLLKFYKLLENMAKMIPLQEDVLDHLQLWTHISN